MSPTRSRSEKDALTVEIVFALLSGALAGGICFLAVGSPALWGGLPTPWKGPWLTASGVLGGAVCAVRVVWVLRRGQPSQPGRTSPDS
ncbi:DUF6332 family protein [Streptomyces sp. Pv4-95]|uniref:DUF6332 family protein n=1 Tax=Streptomyces sp. Pv4-95 TaxID=3049543 RepID=UPI003892A423